MTDTPRLIDTESELFGGNTPRLVFERIAMHWGHLALKHDWDLVKVDAEAHENDLSEIAISATSLFAAALSEYEDLGLDDRTVQVIGHYFAEVISEAAIYGTTPLLEAQRNLDLTEDKIDEILAEASTLARRRLEGELAAQQAEKIIQEAAEQEGLT